MFNKGILILKVALIGVISGTITTIAQPTGLEIVSPGNGSHEGNCVITDDDGFR